MSEHLEGALVEALNALRDPSRHHEFEIHENKRAKIDVSRIRKSLGLSRQEFAFTFGFSLRTVQNWEEHHRTPDGPAKAYLIAIAFAPAAVAKAMRNYREGKNPGKNGHAGATQIPAKRRKAAG